MFLFAFSIAIIVLISNTKLSYGGAMIANFDVEPDNIKAQTCDGDPCVGITDEFTTVAEINFWAFKPQDIGAKICFEYFAGSPVNILLQCKTLIDGNEAEPPNYGDLLVPPDPDGFFPVGTRCAHWYGEIKGRAKNHSVDFQCKFLTDDGNPSVGITRYAASVYYDRF